MNNDFWNKGMPGYTPASLGSAEDTPSDSEESITDRLHRMTPSMRTLNPAVKNT